MSKWYEKDENGYLTKLIIEPTENKMEVWMEVRMKGTQYIVTYVKPPENKNGKVKQEIRLSRKVWDCPDCGYEIKDKNKPCPNCGHEFTYEDLHDGYTPKKERIILVMLFVIGIILFLMGFALVNILIMFMGIMSLSGGLLFYLDYIGYW